MCPLVQARKGAKGAKELVTVGRRKAPTANYGRIFMGPYVAGQDKFQLAARYAVRNALDSMLKKEVSHRMKKIMKKHEEAKVNSSNLK